MDYETTSTPTSEPVITAEPSQEVRAVYDGDISSAILQKLGSYFSEHSKPGDDYVIVRYNQYEYRLYYGDIDLNTLHSGTLVRYYATTSAYNSSYSVSVSEITSDTSIDTSGYSGYIYSSQERFLPNPYISEVKPNILGFVSSTLLLCVVTVVSLASLIRGWFYAGK